MSSDLVSNPAHLSNVLAMLSANKTETIKQGEKLLRPAQKQPMFLLSLLNQIRESPVPEIRHHAALIMRKQLMKYYKKVGVANQNIIKTQLLTIMKSEPVKSVGVSIAGCVAKLAEAIFSIGPEWPDLFAVIVELSQSPSEAHRELNFSLLEQLVERIPTHLKPHTATLVQMLARGFEDSNLHVATSAMQATAGFITSFKDKPEVLQLKVLLTPILNLLQKCIQNGEEAAAAEGLVVFSECVAMKQPLINDHVDQIIPFVASIIQNDSYEPQLKQAAGNTLMLIIEYRPKLVAKKQMVAPTLHAVASIIAQSDASAAGSLFSFNEESGVYTEGDEDADDDDDDEGDMVKLAHVIIDVMAVSIPSKYFIGPALDISAQGMQSPDPKMRKAGCAILGIIAEGCADAVRQMLPSIMPHLIAAAGDAEQGVKETAFFALGQFSENCQPEILFYHETVLPALFNALDDPRHTVQTTACYVIEMFCENLQCETLRPFLKPLLTKLAVLMQSDKEVTRVMALSAISATALAADKDFLPYVDDVFNLLKHRLFTTEPETLSLRGRSLECLGQIAVSVGAQHFAPYFEIGLQSANQGIAMQNDDLKEYAYVYYANTSKAMGKMFSPVLPQLVPHLLEMIGETELIFDEDSDEESEAEEEANGKVTKITADHDDDDEEFEDDEDNDLGIKINGREGYVNTKRTAITAIGSIARYTRADFYPYLKAAFDAITDDRNGPIMSYHDSIKMEAFESFQYLVGVACAYHGVSNVEVDSKVNTASVHVNSGGVMVGIKTPIKGVSIALPDDLHYLVKESLKRCIDACEEEDTKGVVACAYQSITGIIGLVGVVALSLPYVKEGVVQGMMGDKLMQVILKTCQQKLPCQIDPIENNQHDDEEDEDAHGHHGAHGHGHKGSHHKSHPAEPEDENQDDDHDSLVMDDVTDCIGMLAKIMGASFTTHFDVLLPELLKFLEPSRMHSDRSMAIGCFAEVVGEIGSQAEKYIQVALPVVSAGLSDEMESVRRNSAFFLAALIESTGKSLAPNFIQILTWLYPLCTRKPNQQAFDTGGADVDNALSAVGKMISLAPELLPLPQVLPVLLAALPLRSDNTEGPSVYGGLISLVMAQNPVATQHFPVILQSFGQVLSPDSKAIDETKALIISCLKSMMNVPGQNALLVNAMSMMQLTDPIMASCIHQAIISA